MALNSLKQISCSTQDEVTCKNFPLSFSFCRRSFLNLKIIFPSTWLGLGCAEKILWSFIFLDLKYLWLSLHQFWMLRCHIIPWRHSSTIASEFFFNFLSLCTADWLFFLNRAFFFLLSTFTWTRCDCKRCPILAKQENQHFIKQRIVSALGCGCYEDWKLKAETGNLKNE